MGISVELKVLRELFKAGALGGAQILPALMAEDNWTVVINRIDGGQEVLETQRGKEKRYRGLAAAVEDARRIGFREVRVVLPGEHVPIKR